MTYRLWFAILGSLFAVTASGSTILLEDFNSGVPPAGWTVVDNAGTGLVWNTSAFFARDNYTAGDGYAATVDSDSNQGVAFDTELRTPVIDLLGYSSARVDYTANYQNFGGLDYLDLDISTDGGTGWINLLRWNEDHGYTYAPPGVPVSIDLSGYLQSNVMLRWRYYDHTTDSPWDWYAQIDDVAVTGSSVPEPATLGLSALGLIALGLWRRRSRRVL